MLSTYYCSAITKTYGYYIINPTLALNLMPHYLLIYKIEIYKKTNRMAKNEERRVCDPNSEKCRPNRQCSCNPASDKYKLHEIVLTITL